MQLNKVNQLELDENDVALEEQFACPKCGETEYSSIAWINCPWSANATEQFLVAVSIWRIIFFYLNKL